MFDMFGGLIETELESVERKKNCGATRILFHKPKKLPMRGYEKLARGRRPQENVENVENLVNSEAKLGYAIEDVKIEGVNNSSAFGMICDKILHINPERGKHFDSFL
jgi:hypothetical protein